VRRTAAAVAVLAALALAVAGCGGDDSGEGGGDPGTTAAVGTSADAGTVTNADGATCSARVPPPAHPTTYDAPPPMTIDPSKTYRATIATSCGDIVVRLDPKAAPRTVNSFVFLARQGFYDGLQFHRVLRDYIIQGGGLPDDPNLNPGYTYADELPEDGYPTGSIAMANRGPGTSGSQFFIVTGDASLLPNSYNRFGRVIRGMDVAKTIEGFADPAAAPGDPDAGTPSSPVWIDGITIDES
jgi:cyclophilin family peptidyl-prolyl cis-trans isomerase